MIRLALFWGPLFAAACASTPAPAPADAGPDADAASDAADEAKPCLEAGTVCTEGPGCTCGDCCGPCMGSSSGGPATIRCK